MWRLLLVLGALLMPMAGAQALDLGPGPLPIHVDLPSSALITPYTMVVVEGRVEADRPVVVVLRIDDDWSDSSYASRLNEERLTPPGHFRWVLPVHGLRTSGGRALRTEALRRFHLFSGSPSGRVSVSIFRLEEAVALPPGVLALSFGSAQAQLFPGFERVSVGDPRIEGHPAAVLRPGVDPLIGSGLRGVERLKLSWPKGRATITLWLEDVGEWETLPHFLRRRVRINGGDVLDQTLTPQQWIESRYLRGAMATYLPGADSWEIYGRRRGGQITVEVEVTASEGITVELAGDTPAATFLSALLVEPAGSTKALDLVTQQRREWFVNAWPVDATEPTPAVHALPPSINIVLAPGTGRRLEFELSDASAPPAITLDFDGPDHPKFDLWHWVAQRRLDRVSTGENLLKPSLRLLRAHGASNAIGAGVPQKHVVWIAAAVDMPPGIYSGRLKIAGLHPANIPFTIAVPAIQLPPVAKAAGFYLEAPVHLGWFEETAVLADLQLACDMRFLARFGITGNAPPLPAPHASRESAFVAASRQALQNATTRPWLAYSAAKHARDEAGVDGSARLIAQTLKRLKAEGLPSPVWSIADEPSNPGQSTEALRQWATELRHEAPDVRLAGHLNSPRDGAILDLFDVALVNDGFGLDAATLRQIGKRGAAPWLYNTGKIRLSAGLWLWRTDAQRYLQWHARMPTADPFDPTDGREGDVQMFPPTREICAALPDIDEGILEMAEGLLDQRWLTWLSSAPHGTDLMKAIRARLPGDWHSAIKLTNHDLDGLREEIEALARGLK